MLRFVSVKDGWGKIIKMVLFISISLFSFSDGYDLRLEALK